MADHDKTYIKGLKKFKHLFLFANAIHDRTVPFYTAYISLKDPFQNRDFIDYEFFHYDNEKYLLKYPGIDSHPNVKDMFIDMAHSHYLTESTGFEVGVTMQERQFQAFALLALPWIIPIVFAITSVTTLVSHYKVHEASRSGNTPLSINYLGEPDEADDASTILRLTPHMTREQQQHPETGPGSRIAEWAGDAVDEVLGAEGVEQHQLNDFAKEEDSDETVSKKPTTKPSTKPNAELAVRPSLGAGTEGLLDETPHSLPLSPEVEKLVYSLNTLPWEKYVVKLERMHSHAEIVNRRDKPGQGQRIVAFWVELVESKLKADGISTLSESSREVTPEEV